MDDDVLKLKNQLCHRLYTASNAFTRAYRPLLSPLGLTYPQYLVLMALWEQDQVPIYQLIDLTRIDGGSLTQILIKLQSKELIQLLPADDDRRKRIVKLSEKGHLLKEEALKVPTLMACQLRVLTFAEAHQLIALLDKLNLDLDGMLQETLDLNLPHPAAI